MEAQIWDADIVRSTDTPLRFGEVVLTHGNTAAGGAHWQSYDSAPVRHESVTPAQFGSFLRRSHPPEGTVLVEWIDQDLVELRSLSSVAKDARPFYSGDIVRQRPHDAMTGVVTKVNTSAALAPLRTAKCRLEDTHVLSTKSHARAMGKIPLPAVQWVPLSELQALQEPDVDSIVVYGDWLGRVSHITEAHVLLLEDNTAVEVTELHEEFPLLDRILVGDTLLVKKGTLRRGRWVYGRYNPEKLPLVTVAAARVIECGVHWQQQRMPSSGDLDLTRPPPDSLERLHLESPDFHVYTTSRRSNAASDNQTVTFTEYDVSISDRVRFIDLEAACAKYGDALTYVPRSETVGYDINVYDIVTLRKQVHVMWQDQTMTQHDSVDLMPVFQDDDEHSAWPGEVAHTLDLVPLPNLPHVRMPSRVGIVQSVKAVDRMAMIRWCTDPRVHYSIDDTAGSGTEVPKTLVGVGFGLCEDRTEEVSLYDLDTPAALNVRRGDIVLLNELAVSCADETTGLRWLGELVDDRLDGLLLIRLGLANPVQDVIMKRDDVVHAMRRNPDAFGGSDTDEMDLDEEGYDYDSELDNQDGVEEGSDVDMDDTLWLKKAETVYRNEQGERLEASEVDNADWESVSDAESVHDSTRLHDTTRGGESHTDPLGLEPLAGTEPANIEGSMPQYILLEGEPPQDHPQVKSEVEPRHMKSIHKQHKILQKAGALPKGVYVISWESRLNLLRVLLIGPQGTPYADCPFVMDFSMEAGFPEEPPEASFHSWPGDVALGGSGRVNPNLYEDGVICLSLLGTWEGDKQESWDGERSTMLQVIVSLLGLVLVKEPYFNEAGYEAMAGTEAAMRPSMLYNERTTLRALNFAISAVSAVQQQKGLAGLSGLEEVVRSVYLGGAMLLRQLHERVKATLARSEEGKHEFDGLNVLSQGACVQLRRVSQRLESMLSS